MPRGVKMAQAMTAEALVGRVPLFLVGRRTVEEPVAPLSEARLGPSKAISRETWLASVAGQVEFHRENAYASNMPEAMAALHHQALEAHLTSLALQYEAEDLPLEDQAVPIPLAV
jgi:hypothetical protein